MTDYSEDIALIRQKLSVNAHLAAGPQRLCCYGHWDLAHMIMQLLRIVEEQQADLDVWEHLDDLRFDMPKPVEKRYRLVEIDDSSLGEANVPEVGDEDNVRRGRLGP